ncbi:MAG: NAD-dependent epimerase/dehydratase family protein [Gammaproteobacteria bacterium]|nr:NAD-dependent epimerase/dehydratase family protein [Gammaproteobacteria bacterium]
MKWLVTGASGFLGRHVVDAALARGHSVRALLRPVSATPSEWESDPRIEVVRGDLRARGSGEAMAEGVDGVIHLAAAKEGDLYEQFSGTVLATENLIEAMRAQGVERMVLAGSFAVYEYLDLPRMSLLDETTPLAIDPAVRDEYCQTKLVQERLVRRAADEAGWHCVILRPGVIFGSENLWNGRVGFAAGGRWWVCTGSGSVLPVAYVENCAEAFVNAAEYQGERGTQTFNVIDDELPTHRSYLREMRRSSGGGARIIPLPWPVMQTLAAAAALVNRLFFKGTAKLPGLLVPARVHARCRPMRYSNARIKEVLGWAPRCDWRAGIARSTGHGVDA